eukprot:scaffold75561_cov55-Attheya_sp.AAC.8
MRSSKASVTKHSRDDNVYEDSKPPAKRSRDTPGPALLNEDALFLVMEFLPPRDLFHTTFTCKALRDKVTTQVVVRSALIHGGHTKQICTTLDKLMSDKAIHVPSPLRLLRLINGKRCEICVAKKVNLVRPSLGVFACKDCMDNGDLTKVWDTTWDRYQQNKDAHDAIFNHPRLSTNRNWTKHNMWSDHRSDKAGELIGPLITFDDVDQMVSHAHGGIDDYIQNVLCAPPDEDYVEFNETYAHTIERAARVIMEREVKKEARRKVTNQRIIDSRMNRIGKMIAKLAAMLDESFRDAALKRTNIAYNIVTPCMRFNLPFVHNLMEPYIIIPGNIRKHILKEIADEINSKLRLIEEKHLWTLDFLSENDPFEAALKQHFSKTALASYDNLFDNTRYVSPYSGYTVNRFERGLADDKFFKFLKKDQLLDALAHLRVKDLSFLLLPDENAVQRDPLEKKLAKNIWFSNLDKDASDDGRYSRAFASSQISFREATLALKAYSLWLMNKKNNDLRRLNFARHNAFESSSALPFLASKDFYGLYKHQDSAYDSLPH